MQGAVGMGQRPGRDDPDRQKPAPTFGAIAGLRYVCLEGWPQRDCAKIMVWLCRAAARQGGRGGYAGPGTGPLRCPALTRRG